MNEKAKCNKLKGSKFKNNKQIYYCIRIWKEQLSQMTIKITLELIKAPGLHSVVLVGMSTRNAGLNQLSLFSPHFKVINYKTIAMTLTQKNRGQSKKGEVQPQQSESRRPLLSQNTTMQKPTGIKKGVVMRTLRKK